MDNSKPKRRTGPSLEDKKTVGDRLRQRRLSLGLKSVGVLDRLEKDHNIKLDNSTYTGYEKGIRMPDGGLLRRLADCLETNVDYLVGNTEDVSPVLNKQTLSKIIEEGKAFFGDYQITKEDWEEFQEKFLEKK